jgi:hypothetical protein
MRQTLAVVVVSSLLLGCPGGETGSNSGFTAGTALFSTPTAGALHSHNNKLFWFDNDPLANFHSGDASGQHSAIAIRMGIPRNVAVHGQDIYWIEENPTISGITFDQHRWLKKITPTGDVTVLADGQCLTGALVIDTTYVYWLSFTCAQSPTTSTISRLPLAGGPSTNLFTTTGGISALGSDGTSLYWVETSAQLASIKKLPKTGGIPQVVFSSPSCSLICFQDNLVVMNGFVYFSEAYVSNSNTNPETIGYRLRQVPANGGAGTLLLDVPSGGPVLSMAVDTANLYWSDTSTVNAIPLGGGAASILASGLNRPIAIAVDSTNIYWLVATPFDFTFVSFGLIQTTPKTGGAITPIIGNLLDPVAPIAVDSANIYWSEGDPATGLYGLGRIARAPLTGGPDATVASGFLTQASLFLVTDQFIYVADAGTIKKLPLAGGLPERLYAPFFNAGGIQGNTIAALTTDGSNLYFADSNLAGNIYKMSVNGGSVTTLTGATNTTALAVEGNRLYWLDNKTNIKSIPTTGGPITTIFSGPANDILDLITDQNNIFFIQGGQINKISLNGGAVATLVPGAAIGSSLQFTQDNAFIYWTNQTEVGKVAKSGGPVQLYESIVKNTQGGIAVDSTRVYWIRDGVMYSAPK